MENIIELPRSERAAEFRAASFDEGDNTIELIWTTGATVRRYNWADRTYYNEELVVSRDAVRLERLNAGAPFLNTHSDYTLSDVIGSVVPGSARIANGQGVARVLLSRAAGDADNIQKIKDGVIRNISVGYAIHAVEKIESDSGAIPVWRVIDWEPLEISAVPVPADAGAQIRSAPRDAAPLYPCRIIKPEPISHAAARARMSMKRRLVGA